MSDAEPLRWEEFERVAMHVGRIVEVIDFPEARRPAWRLRLDFGTQIGELRSSAQITTYTRAELEGRLVVAVVNFPPKQIGRYMSECLVLGTYSDGVVLLVDPAPDAVPGDRVG